MVLQRTYFRLTGLMSLDVATPLPYTWFTDERQELYMAGISYRYGNDLDQDHVIELYVKSTLGERRPVHERRTMQAMLDRAYLGVDAWDGERLVRIACTLSDVPV